MLFPFISSVILKCIFVFYPHFQLHFRLSYLFSPEHYEMTLHAYVNSVRNSLKDNIHLTASASTHLHSFCHIKSFWPSSLMPKLLWFFFLTLGLKSNKPSAYQGPLQNPSFTRLIATSSCFDSDTFLPTLAHHFI